MEYNVLNDGEGTLVRLCEKTKSVMVESFSKNKVNSQLTPRNPSVQCISLLGSPGQSTKSTLSPTGMVCWSIVCFLC